MSDHFLESALRWTSTEGSPCEICVSVEDGARRTLISHIGSHDQPIAKRLVLENAQFSDLECLLAIPLSSLLGLIEQADFELGCRVVILGSGVAARLWKVVCQLCGYVPVLAIERIDELTRGDLEQFINKTDRELAVVDTIGDKRSIEYALPLLGYRHRFIFSGAQTACADLYLYRDVHKKGVTLLGSSPCLVDVFDWGQFGVHLVHRALNFMRWRGLDELHSLVEEGGPANTAGSSERFVFLPMLFADGASHE